MTVLHFKHSPLIERIEIRQAGYAAQATIIPPENADPDKLEQLRIQLGRNDFSTLMDTVNGRAAIQVRGLRDEKILLSALEKLGYAHDKMDKGSEKRPGFSERVRKKSLFLSAIFYDIGNAAFFASGIQRGRHNLDGKFTANDISEMMIGGAFTVGDVLMTAYGHTKGDEELEAASMGLKRHLHHKGITLPQGNELNPDTLHQSGAVKVADRWLRKHIIQVKCMSEFLGGLFTIHSALKPNNRNNGKLVAGILITIGWLATFVFEKPRGEQIFDGDTEKQGFIENVKHNPRGWIARPFAMGNNVFNLWGSLNPIDGERKKYHDHITNAKTPEMRAWATRKQHDYGWNVVSACSFLVAHVLFGLSGSKRPKETEDDKAVMQDLVLLSANVLARQPKQIQDAAVAETAEYVSRLAHVTLSKEQLATAISDKIASLSQSSWVTRVHPPNASGPQLA